MTSRLQHCSLLPWLIAVLAGCGRTASGPVTQGSDAATGPGAATPSAPVGVPSGGADGGVGGGGPVDGTDAGPDGGASGSAAGGAAATIVRTFVFVGGWDWNDATSYPVQSFALDRATGALAKVSEASTLGPNPSFITPGPGGRFLYIANERSDANGGITVASVNPVDGSLGFRGHQTTGVDFVFTSVDPSGRFALAASYNGAQVSSFPIASDGTLGAAAGTFRFATGAEAHSVRVSPATRTAYVPCKGAGTIAALDFDGESGKLTARAPAADFDAGAGSEPRHVALGPTGTLAYVVSEGPSELTSFRAASDGTLTPIASLSTLPTDFTGTSTGAHVLVHPRGGFVYASNRGHDSIAVFADDGSGHLALLQHQPTLGKTPRNFDIDDAGEWMVVANQDSGSVAVFRVNADGRLTAVGTPIGGLSQPNSVAIVNVRAP